MCLWIRFGFYLLLYMSFCGIWKFIGWRHLCGDHHPLLSPLLSLCSSHLPGNLTQTTNHIHLHRQPIWIDSMKIFTTNVSLYMRKITRWHLTLRCGKKHFIRFDWIDMVANTANISSAAMKNGIDDEGTTQCSWLSSISFREKKDTHTSVQVSLMRAMQWILMVMKWLT